MGRMEHIKTKKLMYGKEIPGMTLSLFPFRQLFLRNGNQTVIPSDHGLVLIV